MAKASEQKDAVESTETAMPVMMSERQKIVFQTVQAATAEPRRIESVEDLAPRILMQVPEAFTKTYPDRYYAWADANEIDQTVEADRGYWQVVNRINHPKIPDRYFHGTTGGVMYGGQNVLVYTWKQNAELREKAILARMAEIDGVHQRAINQQIKGAEGKTAGVIEQVSDPGDGKYATDLELDTKYDYGSPR